MNRVAMQSMTSQVNSPTPAARILVVDDEQHMCDVCSRTLSRSGYEVATTSDPAVAIRLLGEDRPFDLLLTDIKMPTMSGLDLAHLARERDPAIAIIIMTGFASFENMQQSVQRGVADFLSKPFELEQLRLAVEQALHKRTILQDNLRLRALEQLVKSSETLSTTLEVAELAHLLLRITLEQSGCRAGFVLKTDGYAPLTLLAASFYESELLPAGYALAQQASEQRQYLANNNEPFCRVDGQELNAALAVALRAQGEVNAVLVLCDNRPSVLRPGVQESVALVANHAGAALRNALLYQQLGDAYQRLQELDRLKSEFISIASHELRTPLSIVLGYTMMLREQSRGEQHEYAQRVMESAQRIKEIVDDMVSLRHLETGEARLHEELCVVQELLAEVTGRMRTSAEARQHHLQIETSDQPIYLRCDREKVLLILSHLISNAIKFTPDGGQIIVRAQEQQLLTLHDSAGRTLTHAVPPDRHAPSGWVVLEVEDSGIGVPEREQSRIFDRFYQVADSLTRDHGGTGLGLAIVRELVSALDGAVWVTSREQQGSIFAFALPIRQE